MRIIADACWNHNGDMEVAKQMIGVAKVSGATDIKFQMGRDLPWGEPEHAELMEYCRAAGIHYLCTAFDSKALAVLVALGVDEIKIGSAEAANLDFVREVVATGKKIIISTGGMDAGMFGELIQILPFDAIVMHCVSIYPTPYNKINLNVITDMKMIFQNVGFSDHSADIFPCFGAAALGACAVEKHFILNNIEAKDKPVSIRPWQLYELAQGCNAIQQSLGFEKIFHEEEKEVMKKYR